MPPEKLSDTIQNDILKEFMVRNTYIHPPEPSCASSPTSSPPPRARCRSSPDLDPGYHMQEAGRRRTWSSATRSPTASSTRAPASRRSLAIDAFAPRLSFFWAIGMNFFMEIAKMRAARLLWARLIKQEFSPRTSARCRSGRTRRRAAGASRAGRVQQRHAHGAGGARRDPGPHAVAAYERARRGDLRCRPTSPPASRATRSSSSSRRAAPAASPTSRAAYVERLTYELARRAMARIDEVEALGGMARAIAAGVPKMRIEEARRARRRASTAAARRSSASTSSAPPTTPRSRS